MVLSDLDGDNDLDIAEANTGNSSGGLNNTVWINDGSGGFTDSGVAKSESGSRTIAVTDVDADGDIDLITGKQYVDNIWLNKGADPVDFTATYQPR